MRTASEPSTWASKLPVTHLVFRAQGAFARSTPCVCALRGFLPGRVFPDRTARRHGLARLPPNWVGLAEHAVTFGAAAGEEGDSTFLGVVVVRQPASGGTSSVLLLLVSRAAGGAPQLQNWQSPAGSMADEGVLDTLLVSRCLVSGGMGLPAPEADLRWTIAAPVQAPRMRVPAGSGLCSSPCPRASIRLGLSPRREPPRGGTHPEAA